MPYVLIKSWFPPRKAEEVAKGVMEELKNNPLDRSLGKSLVTALKSNENGIASIEIIEVKEGKLEENLSHYSNALLMYQKIEGFRYTIEVWSTIVEAMGMFGMKLPE